MKPPSLLFFAAAFLLLIASCEESEKSIPVDPTPAPPVVANKPIPKKTKTKRPQASQSSVKAPPIRSLEERLALAKNYVEQNGYSTEYCFLVDLGIKSGKNRFFVYSLETNTILSSGLVAHGSCNTDFLSQVRFSNAPDCGCSSSGKYKVGSFYQGKYGKSFRLYGLDKSNSNAFKRGIVLHGHECVPDDEIFPQVLCNSFGCPMVSEPFFEELSGIIEESEKPILLWMYN